MARGGAMANGVNIRFSVLYYKPRGQIKRHSPTHTHRQQRQNNQIAVYNYRAQVPQRPSFAIAWGSGPCVWIACHAW